MMESKKRGREFIVYFNISTILDHVAMLYQRLCRIVDEVDIEK